MRPLLLAALALLSAFSLDAAVVRLAPDFSFPGVGRSRSLRSLRGQAVVLLVARSPKEGDFKKQLKSLREIYQQFASKQVVFIAALREGEGPIRSNIPFAVASNGPAVADAYGVADDFSIVIIGRDGNIDYQTSKVLPPERVRDVIQNSFTVQVSGRKQ
jgi:peroxiredoxin